MTRLGFFKTAFLALIGICLGAAASPAQQPMDRDELVQLGGRIRKAIVTLDNYGVFDSVNATITAGQAGYVVRLTGYASRPTLKSSAEKVVKQLPRVESVDNQIEVLPNSRMDEDVRLEAYVRIYGHPTLVRYNPNRGVPIYGLERRAYMGISRDPPIGFHPIHIIVKDGHIILDGVVDNEGDKSIVNMQANSVRGAFSVTNNLQVMRSGKPEK